MRESERERERIRSEWMKALCLHSFNVVTAEVVGQLEAINPPTATQSGLAHTAELYKMDAINTAAAQVRYTAAAFASSRHDAETQTHQAKCP